jgi:putative ABC transport system permease protein
MLLRALSLRPALAAPWRLAATVAGVAAGIAAVVATVAASRAAVASLREGVAEMAGRAAVEATMAGGVPESALAALLPLAPRAVIVPVVEDAALAPRLGDAVRVLGIDPLVDAAGRRFELVGGAAAPEVFERLLRGEGVLVSERLAAALGVADGGRFELAVRSRPVELRVLARFRAGRLAAAWDRVVVADIALAQRLFGAVGRVDRVELVPRSNAPGDDEIAALRAGAARLLPPGAIVRTPAERGDAGGRMVRALEFNLTALAGVSLFVGGALVATALATAVVQRRRLIALAVSLGAARGQIARVLLAEAAAVGVLGGALGVAAGTVGARLAAASVRDTVSVVARAAPPAAVHLPWWLAAGGIALGVLVALAAAALPLAEARAVPPIQGLRDERPASLAPRRRRRELAAGGALALAAALLAGLPALGDLPVAALAASLCLLLALLALAPPLLDALAGALAVAPRFGVGSPVKVAAAALRAGLRRAAWAAGAVGVAVALAVSVGTMVHSFRATVERWAAQAMRSDLWIRPLASATGVQVGRLDPEVVAIAESVFGRDTVDPFHATTVEVAGMPVTFAGGAMDVIATRGGVPFRDGRDSRAVFAATRARQACVVNEPFARRAGVREGDVVRIRLPRGEVERRVEGVFYDYSHHLGMVVVDRADYLSLLPDEGPQEIAVFLPPGSDAAAARDRLTAALGGRFLVETFLNAELRAEVMAIFDRTFAITRALQTVAAAVAVLAVLSTLYTLVDERRRDLAVLRALGGSRVQVTGVVLTQAGLLGAVGSLAGLAVGLAVGAVLVTVVNVQSFAWTLELLPPWGSLAATFALVVAMCVLAGLAPAAAAARASVREALHEDG